MVDKEMEQTLVLIKPDAMKNSLTGYVLSQLSEFHTGLRFAGTKIVHVSRMLAEEHYAEHRGKFFYEPLLQYIQGELHYPTQPNKRRVIAIIYQGLDSIKKVRDVAGPTNPLSARDQRPGCIRSLGTLAPVLNAGGEKIGDRMDNLIHASANEADAEREIKLWFKPNDIPPSMHAYATEQSEDHYYFLGNKLYHTHEAGSLCILAPGDTAWASDLAILKKISSGDAAPASLETVVAKYMINESAGRA